ncbi:hypothetical protein V8E55_004606 [Tylopilus felleus]
MIPEDEDLPDYNGPQGFDPGPLEMKEIAAEDGHQHFTRYAQEFHEKSVAEVLGTSMTSFERMVEIQEGSGQGIYSPFIIGNRDFHGDIAYAPEKVYSDDEGRTRRYDEMWTGDWWWETQCCLPEGATIAPMIIASDKTKLYPFKGDKSAWPVYLSIGNLSKKVRFLVGYILVSKLHTFENNLVAGYRLFHSCMKRILEPLVAAGQEGVEMVSDGWILRVFPLLAAYVSDHPEQCLIAGYVENRCPKCLVPVDQSGANIHFACRDQAQITHTLYMQATGIFKDHLKQWCLAIAGKKSFDARFQAMSSFRGLHHWKQGILVLQWVFISTLVGTTQHQEVLKVSRALLNFIYLAQYQSHTDETLFALQHALNEFHANKEIFITLECRAHFNLPKLHSLQHYIEMIKKFGSLNGLNTENSEHLHIDYTKKAYAASNRKDYTIQMTKWLQHQEAVIWFKSFLAWCHGNQAEDLPMDINILQYRTSHRPHFPKKSVQYLAQEHGANNFVEELEGFLAHTGLDHQYVQPNVNDHFDCFSNIVLPLQAIEHLPDDISARIHCHSQQSNGPHKPPTPARYDTVLIQLNEEAHDFQGLCAAKVHVIFKLPGWLGHYPYPLLFQHFDSSIGMFRVSHSTRNRVPNAIIIPITNIVQPCHLVPRFPSGVINPLWTPSQVMVMADTFFLNRYIDFRIFEQYRLLQ